MLVYTIAHVFCSRELQYGMLLYMCCDVIKHCWWLGVAVASFITWTKLLCIEPGEYWDRWPSLGGYTTSVCNQV